LPGPEIPHPLHPVNRHQEKYMANDFTQKLRDQGFRLTPQRLAILNILQHVDRHLSPLEVYDFARQALPGITEATVYRTLNWLTGQGLVLAAHIGNGQLVYEIAGHNHHHLICRHCGGTQEISHSLLEALYQQFQANTGYQIDSVHVTFFGLCPHCQKN
jgi:Fur family transcriptional regulator, ferric uptake regulator